MHRRFGEISILRHYDLVKVGGRGEGGKDVTLVLSVCYDTGQLYT